VQFKRSYMIQLQNAPHPRDSADEKPSESEGSRDTASRHDERFHLGRQRQWPQGDGERDQDRALQHERAIGAPADHRTGPPKRPVERSLRDAE
jgi:hypothetical protein